VKAAIIGIRTLVDYSIGLKGHQHPHRIFPLNPGDCHPFARLSLLRSLSVWRREDERLDTIAADTGWSLEGGKRLTGEERIWGSSSARKQE
jgi:hypothetical protein